MRDHHQDRAASYLGPDRRGKVRISPPRFKASKVMLVFPDGERVVANRVAPARRHSAVTTMSRTFL